MTHDDPITAKLHRYTDTEGVVYEFDGKVIMAYTYEKRYVFESGRMTLYSTPKSYVLVREYGEGMDSNAKEWNIIRVSIVSKDEIEGVRRRGFLARLFKGTSISGVLRKRLKQALFNMSEDAIDDVKRAILKDMDDIMVVRVE